MTATKMLVMAATVLIATGSAWADTTMSFSPTPSDLYDLDHTKVYRWGFDVSVPEGETIQSATLTFTNIRNWDNQPNILYVELLDWTELGIRQTTDNEHGGNNFATYGYAHTPLVTYQNLPTTAQTLVYTFTAPQVAALNSYLADGRIGLGFDPDCHFYNDGISFQMVTPEPGTIALLCGVVPFLLRRRIAA